MSAFEIPTIAYWNIRGLGAPLRMMAMFGELQFYAENYYGKSTSEGFDMNAWFVKKPDIKAKNPLANLPYIIDGDIVVTQSNACISYLGRKLKMMGDNEKETVDIEQLLCECMDLRNKVVGMAYGGCDDIPGWLSTTCGKNSSVEKLNNWLAAKYPSETGDAALFFVGNKASACDFHIWEMCDQLIAISKGFSDGSCPVPSMLEKFHKSFAALPQNAAYLNSKLAKLPMNNLMAKVGSHPSGAAFVKGSDIPWNDSTGQY